MVFFAPQFRPHDAWVNSAYLYNVHPRHFVSSNRQMQGDSERHSDRPNEFASLAGVGFLDNATRGG
jgi:hypothetical protein